MKREHLAFLLAGVAFGVLIGLAIQQWRLAPDQAQRRPAASAPAGPAAPTQTAGGGPAQGAAAGGDAPMMAEISELRQRVEQDPSDLESLTRLANLYHDAQMWEPAKSFYERAIELSPEDPDLVTDYGVCFVGTGDFQRAIDLFARAQEIDPSHPQSLFNTAVVRGVHMRDREGALAMLDRLDAIVPGFPRSAELRAQLESAGP